jgi:phospholipase/carboxylesterase
LNAISHVLHQGASITKASKALLLLHGRGSTAEDIISLAPQIANEDFYIAAPQAATHAWYPYSFLAEEQLNEPALSLSVAAIKNLIDEIEKHIPKQQIYIMGFSQGACLALEVSARYAAKYGGVIALTGGLIGKRIDESKYKGNFEGSHIWISNGDQDPHVPLSRSEQSKQILEKMGGQVILKVYRQKPHSVSEDELHLIKSKILLL